MMTICYYETSMSNGIQTSYKIYLKAFKTNKIKEITILCTDKKHRLDLEDQVGLKLIWLGEYIIYL